MDDVRLPGLRADGVEDALTTGRRSVRGGRAGRVEMNTRGERRRVWRTEQKREIVAESLDPGAMPADVARRYGIGTGLLYTWRRQFMEGQLGAAPQPLPGFARVEPVPGAPGFPAPLPPVAEGPAPRVLPPPPTPPVAAVLRGAGLIEIALPGGALVRVDAHVDADALRRVLGVLEGR